mmetsp:Transcript_14275/g.28843  ORF Transcript_14275/g.28843 Transcript_14275/m.28843 type:complete len:106 (+) Transcript_14275:260-577(+)
MKRKDGDHLQLNGVYVLQPDLHNGAPCWVKVLERVEPGESGTSEADEARVLFRAADGSWMIDSRAHDGGPDELVAARLQTSARDPTRATEAWAPIPALRVRALHA